MELNQASPPITGLTIDELTAYVHMTINVEINKVTSTLYIGSKYFEIEDLQDRGVTHVLNLSDSDDPLPIRSLFSYLHNYTPDDGAEKSHEYWQRSLDFAAGAPVLYVHCHAGVNRSAATAYLLLRLWGYPPNQAWKTLSSARSVVRPRYVDQVESFIRKEITEDERT